MNPTSKDEAAKGEPPKGETPPPHKVAERDRKKNSTFRQKGHEVKK